MVEMSTPPRQTFAELLEHLFVTHPNPATRRRYSDAEVAIAVGISKTAVWALRTGQSSNPTLETIYGLARFFGVTPGYFFGEHDTIDPELRAAMADAGVRHIAARAAGLTEQSQQMVLNVLEQVRRLEHRGE